MCEQLNLTAAVAHDDHMTAFDRSRILVHHRVVGEHDTDLQPLFRRLRCGSFKELDACRNRLDQAARTVDVRVVFVFVVVDVLDDFGHDANATGFRKWERRHKGTSLELRGTDLPEVLTLTEDGVEHLFHVVPDLHRTHLGPAIEPADQVDELEGADPPPAVVVGALAAVVGFVAIGAVAVPPMTLAQEHAQHLLDPPDLEVFGEPPDRHRWRDLPSFDTDHDTAIVRGADLALQLTLGTHENDLQSVRVLGHVPALVSVPFQELRLRERADFAERREDQGIDPLLRSVVLGEFRETRVLRDLHLLDVEFARLVATLLVDHGKVGPRRHLPDAEVWIVGRLDLIAMGVQRLDHLRELHGLLTRSCVRAQRLVEDKLQFGRIRDLERFCDKNRTARIRQPSFRAMFVEHPAADADVQMLGAFGEVVVVAMEHQLCAACTREVQLEQKRAQDLIAV